MTSTLHVAVAVIKRSDRILIAKRPQNLHKGGFWEFPGGKVEKGESIEKGLIRECKEELGITPIGFEPYMTLEHSYPAKDGHRAKKVLLDVWLVTDFLGEAKGLEKQPIKWCSLAQLNDFQFPEANISIIKKLNDEFG